MPLFAIVRFLATLLSLTLLAVAGWLLWSWNQGEWWRDAAGDLHRLREDWRLWTGLGLVAWSFGGGRLLLPFLLARGGGPRSRPVRGEGRMIEGVDGAPLYIETHGRPEAPVIVLTHGWGMDSTFWNLAKQHLSGRFRLVLWELPGLGKSKSAPASDICLPRFARHLARVIEAEAPGRRVVLVGHSIGGMTIQTLLRDQPGLQDRLAGVVLLNTTYTNPLKTMILSGLLRALQKPVIEPMMKLTVALAPLVWLSKWQSYHSGSAHLGMRLGFGRHVNRSQLDHAALLSTRNPPAAEARGDLAMFDWDATDALAHRLRVPALVVGGDRDIVTKLEASRAIAAQNSLIRLEVVPGANHMGPLEQAEIYNRLIADFALAVQTPAASDHRPSAAGAAAPELRSPPLDHRPGV